MNDGYIKIGQSIGLVLTPNELVFNDHAFKNDNVHRKYLRLYEQSIKQNLNGTVTMNFVVPNRTTTTISRGTNTNSGKESDYIQQFFKDLVANGLVSLNTEINLAFSNNHLNISGKKIDKATFERIKRDFERYASAKGHYSIAFNGSLSNLTRSGIDINGSLSTSLNND